MDRKKKEIEEIKVTQYRWGHRSRAKQLPDEIPGWAGDLFLMFEEKVNQIVKRLNEQA